MQKKYFIDDVDLSNGARLLLEAKLQDEDVEWCARVKQDWDNFIANASDLSVGIIVDEEYYNMFFAMMHKYVSPNYKAWAQSFFQMGGDE